MATCCLGRRSPGGPTRTPPDGQGHVCEQTDRRSGQKGPSGPVFPISHLVRSMPDLAVRFQGTWNSSRPASVIRMRVRRTQGFQPHRRALPCVRRRGCLQVWAREPPSGILHPLEAQARKEKGCSVWSCRPQGLSAAFHRGCCRSVGHSGVAGPEARSPYSQPHGSSATLVQGQVPPLEWRTGFSSDGPLFSSTSC